MFLKRLGPDPHLNGQQTVALAGCPDLLELEDGLLIPFVNDICVGIKPEAGRIEVILPDGLIELFREQQ